MISNMPTIGVRFDIEKVDAAHYGIACWKIFWQAIIPDDIGVAYLYEGDTAATLDGPENVFCIAVQSPDGKAIAKIKAALTQSEDFKRVCANPMFVEGPSCTAEPLPDAGRIDENGNLDSKGASYIAFEAVKVEHTTVNQVSENTRISKSPAPDSDQTQASSAISSDIFEAARTGDLAKVKELVEKGADIDEKDASGNTPLHLAAREGHIEVLKYLVEKGANVQGAFTITISIMEYGSFYHYLWDKILKASDPEQVNSMHEIYCAECGSAFPKDIALHLMLAELKNVTIMGRSPAGDAIRSGVCPYCGHHNMKIVINNNRFTATKASFKKSWVALEKIWVLLKKIGEALGLLLFGVLMLGGIFSSSTHILQKLSFIVILGCILFYVWIVYFSK